MAHPRLAIWVSTRFNSKNKNFENEVQPVSKKIWCCRQRLILTEKPILATAGSKCPFTIRLKEPVSQAISNNWGNHRDGRLPSEELLRLNRGVTFSQRWSTISKAMRLHTRSRDQHRRLKPNAIFNTSTWTPETLHPDACGECADVDGLTCQTFQRNETPNRETRAFAV
jgi:hypothetical protein